MKLAKQIIVLMLLVSLCLSLLACTDANVLGVRNPTTPLAVSDGSTISDSETPVAYRNDYFKYTCELPDDWYVMNEDEIAQMVGYTTDALGEGRTADILKESMEKGENLIDFYAVSGDFSQTTNVVIGKAKTLELLISEQAMIDAGATLLTDGLTNMGVTNISHHSERVEFLGKERVALYVQGDYQGGDLYEIIFIMRKGLYISNFAFTGSNQSAVANSIQYFQPID